MIIGILTWATVNYGNGYGNKTEFKFTIAKENFILAKVSNLAQALQFLEDQGWEYHYSVEGYDRSKQMVFKQKVLGPSYREPGAQ